jgi:hypothetical protein
MQAQNIFFLTHPTRGNMSRSSRGEKYDKEKKKRGKCKGKRGKGEMESQMIK